MLKKKIKKRDEILREMNAVKIWTQRPPFGHLEMFSDKF